MSSFGTFNVARSGLYAAQTNLAITGHNLSNIGTKGYTRQQALQSDVYYRNLGYTASSTKQVGLGTDIKTIRQIRDNFLDINFRKENSKAGYYETKINTSESIERIVGELQSQYTTQGVLHDLKNSLNELTINPDNIASRGNFVSTSVTLIDKFQNIYEELVAEQKKLDNEVRTNVGKINNLVEVIRDLGVQIKKAEAIGERPNDYKDMRNTALDELSAIIPIDFLEKENGDVDILTNGKTLISNGISFNIGLRYTTGDYDFVEPVFANTTEILSADKTQYTPLFEMKGDISSRTGKDTGILRALLFNRGYKPITHMDEAISPNPADYGDGKLDLQYKADKKQYEKDKFNIETATIPRFMKNIDKVFNRVVTLINDKLSPKNKSVDDPYGLDGTQHMELFVRKIEPYKNRYDGSDDYIIEDKDDKYSQYTIGNVEVNPILFNVDGFDKIPLSISGDVSDTNLILEILDEWDEKIIDLDNTNQNLGINEAYAFIISTTAGLTEEDSKYLDQQRVIINQLDSMRSSISAVALDEEMVAMMKFQHSYNASARLLNTIDSMIETIVNKLGRVGL